MFKRVFLTGATGFLGSHMARYLIRRGIQTAALRRSDSSMERVQDIVSSVNWIEADYFRPGSFAGPLKKFQPDACLHFGWSGADQSQYQDARQITQGVPASLGLLEICAEAGCKLWAGLGSQAEYGPKNRIIREEEPPEPVSLYGTAKLAVCRLAAQRCRQLKMDFLWFRLFTAYGPADNPRWLIPYLVAVLLKGGKPSLTAGEQRWDFLYVQDAVEAVWKACESPGARGIFNLGSGIVVTVRQAAEKIRDLVSPGSPLGLGEKPYAPDQIMHLQADVGRLKSLAGWSPRHSFEQGLRETVDWYKKIQ